MDAVFHAGDKHAHHSDTAQKMVPHVVDKIRKHYRVDAPVVIRLDSCFSIKQANLPHNPPSESEISSVK